ncbi:MAG: Holliday junction resolvase RuvX [Tenericutes bacterium]|nr:Holliday junction resolvase RuvX [Mycoplasmatota bacterium]
MRYLGLDLGSKTLGVSLSDFTNTIASNYDIIRFKNEDYVSLVNSISDIIKDNDIGYIVLGLPKNMNNTIGTRANISYMFKDLLEKKYNIPVILEDERLTSRISNDILIKADMTRKKRKKVVDKMASTIILQSYLDRINK